MQFHITGLKRADLSKQFVLEALRFIFQNLSAKKIRTNKSSLVVAFVSEKSITELNARFLKKNKPTDVLSFSPTEKDSLGELAVCCNLKRAASRGWSQQEEVFFLLLHGVLHLLGYSHEQGGAKARQMFRLQDHIFQQWKPPS